MSNGYCWKFKRNFLRFDERNAYKLPGIEKLGLGFERMIGEDGLWAKGWAKPVEIKTGSKIAEWMEMQMEIIYARESAKESSHWIEEMSSAGYAFDEKGYLIENEAFLSGLHAQLCVMADESEEDKGILFVNCGSVAFHDLGTVTETDPDAVEALLSAKAIYKRRMPF